MSRTAFLRESRDDKAVKFLEFIRLYSRNRDNLCCFFEGDDSKYYCIRVDMVLKNRSWSFINCRGKAQVLGLYELILNHKDYSSARVAFFVDRDYDAPLAPATRNRLYETPCYSVENFFTSLGCFRQILKSEFGITEGGFPSETLDRCSELFRETQRMFHDAMTELNAWIYIQRNSNKAGPSILNLRNVKFDRFVAVGLGAVNKLYTLQELTELFPVAPPVDEQMLRAKVLEFQNADRQRLFRGKYEAEFLRLFLAKLIDDFSSKAPNFFPKSGKVKCHLSRENLISELSQYADTPDCLREFLLCLN